MEQINLVYIDDTPDLAFSRFLDNLVPSDSYDAYTINYEEIIFPPQQDYEYLLKHDSVKKANIIIVDSWLFENRTVANNKFTGEEFKFVLQKVFPYIEVIVISQNQDEPGIRKLPKYSKKIGYDPFTYYNGVARGTIELAILNVLENRRLAKKLSQNDTWEALLKEKVLGTLSGAQAYDELKKEDIDTLILAFKEIQEIANGGGL
jgi:hypothetical protein